MTNPERDPRITNAITALRGFRRLLLATVAIAGLPYVAVEVIRGDLRFGGFTEEGSVGNQPSAATVGALPTRTVIVCDSSSAPRTLPVPALVELRAGTNDPSGPWLDVTPAGVTVKAYDGDQPPTISRSTPDNFMVFDHDGPSVTITIDDASAIIACTSPPSARIAPSPDSARS